MAATTFKILLIEGDTDETSLVKRYLGGDAGASVGFEVVEAVRVSSACRALANQKFDAVVLDLQVPQNAGLDGFNRIRAQRPELPIVLLTGLHDEALAAQAVRCGAQDYLVKGTLDCCLLQRALRHAIEKKKLMLQLERLLEQDAAPKLVVDGDGAVLYANAAASSMTGASVSAMAGKPFAYPRAAGAQAKGSTASSEMSVAAFDWNGAPARLISFHGKPAREAVGTRGADAAELRRLDDIKSQFTRRLAHEMRNTMSTVKTALFCLKDPQTGPLAPRQGRLVDMVSRNADRQVRLFDKIMDLGAFQAGKLPFNLRPLEMSEVIDEFTRETEFKNQDVRVEASVSGALPAVDGDADMILQVLRHLLDNATRHARTKVLLEASADEAGGVRIAVTDDGAGIPQDRLADLFTPFGQLDKRKGAAGFKGGLGLTMSREIVDGHGGRIWAESGHGGGRVVFTLPGLSPAGALSR